MPSRHSVILIMLNHKGWDDLNQMKSDPHLCWSHINEYKHWLLKKEICWLHGFLVCRFLSGQLECLSSKQMLTMCATKPDNFGHMLYPLTPHLISMLKHSSRRDFINTALGACYWPDWDFDFRFTFFVRWNASLHEDCKLQAFSGE